MSMLRVSLSVCGVAALVLTAACQFSHVEPYEAAAGANPDAASNNYEDAYETPALPRATNDMYIGKRMRSMSEMLAWLEKRDSTLALELSDQYGQWIEHYDESHGLNQPAPSPKGATPVAASTTMGPPVESSAVQMPRFMLRADDAPATDKPAEEEWEDIDDREEIAKRQAEAQRNLHQKWDPDKPFEPDSAPMPADGDVRTAITNGCNYLLRKQKEDGSWDVVMKGLMAGTADQAVDAVTATALCGLALRPHANTDPERIEPAIRKGLDFVMRRILQGRLSTAVFYAIWRYTLGIKFLNQEYKFIKGGATPDPDKLDEITLVAKRMMQSLLNMQFAKGGGRTDISGKAKKALKTSVKDAQSATLGMVLAPPTAEDYRGGALIIGIVPGSGADITNGPKIGDRVISLATNPITRVENSYDYYLAEVDFREGQAITVSYKRPAVNGGAPVKITQNFKIPQKWPANIGVKIESAGDRGVKVIGYTPASVARKADILVGDIITAIGNTKLEPDPKKPDEDKDWVKKFYDTEAKSKPRTAIAVTRERGGKSKKINLESKQVRPKPEATLGFDAVEEDPCSLDGVAVDSVYDGTEAKKLGMTKGGRVLAINGQTILGMDHFNAYLQTLWADTMVKVKYLHPNFTAEYEEDTEKGIKKTGTDILNDLKNYEEKELEMRLGASVEPGDPQVGWELARLNGRPMLAVDEVVKGGVSDGKLMKGDIIIAVNGEESIFFAHTLFQMNQVAAEDICSFGVVRDGKEIKVDVEFAKAKEADEITAEGGWNYYPRGLGTSFTTAATIIALHEVNETMKLQFPPLKMKAAVNAIRDCLKLDSNSNENGFIYDQRKMDEKDPKQAKGIAAFRDIRGGMGRITACQVSMVLEDKKTQKASLKGVLELWLKNRHEIDRLRNFWHTHYYPRFANAAYYWMYGHYHAVVAANLLDTSPKNKTAQAVRDTTLKVVMMRLNDRRPGALGSRRPAGTWIGHEGFGPLCGTCEALMILGEIPGGFRGGTVTPGGVSTPDKSKTATPAKPGEAPKPGVDKPATPAKPGDPAKTPEPSKTGDAPKPADDKNAAPVKKSA
jgi:S1-C subfamily serine protease